VTSAIFEAGCHLLQETLLHIIGSTIPRTKENGSNYVNSFCVSKPVVQSLIERGRILTEIFMQ